MSPATLNRPGGILSPTSLRVLRPILGWHTSGAGFRGRSPGAHRVVRVTLGIALSDPEHETPRAGVVRPWTYPDRLCLPKQIWFSSLSSSSYGSLGSRVFPQAKQAARSTRNAGNRCCTQSSLQDGRNSVLGRYKCRFGCRAVLG